MTKIQIQKKIVLIGALTISAFLISCKNLPKTDENGFIVGRSTSAPTIDRKEIIKSDKKKQSDLDLPFRGFNYEKKITQIATGSCADQDLPQPIWKTIDKNNPDLFIFSGDTVYASKNSQKPLAQQFRKLNKIADYRNFREKVPFMVVWDDHDFGINDGGADNPEKEAYRTEFVKYWSYLDLAIPRDQKALYHAKIFGPKKQKVQVIMLDTRWDRSPLKKNPEVLAATEVPAVKPDLASVGAGDLASPNTVTNPPGNSSPPPLAAQPIVAVEVAKAVPIYVPDEDKSKHFLSETQWSWLEGELKKPAELRLLVSSIQVIPTDHGFEKWGNFPKERERLFRLLAKTKAKNTVIISGDRHLSSIAKTEIKGLGTVLELTASSLNKEARPGNVYSDSSYLKEAYGLVNFGLLKINWETRKVTLEVRSLENQVKNSAEAWF